MQVRQLFGHTCQHLLFFKIQRFDTSDCLNEQANDARGPEGSQAAVSGRSETDKSALEERLRNEAANSLATKQRRRSLLADVAACTSANRS